MTPFGRRIRELRARDGVTLKAMAEAIGVTSAYLSALEHGHRGRPSWYLIQRMIAYFNLIWDDAEDLVRLANRSHPRVTIDTSGLAPEATELAHLLSEQIADMPVTRLTDMIRELRGEPVNKPVDKNRKTTRKAVHKK